MANQSYLVTKLDYSKLKTLKKGILFFKLSFQVNE